MCKTTIRSLSCVLVIMLFLLEIIPSSFEASPNHTGSESLLSGDNRTVNYYMSGNDVVENAVIYGQGRTSVRRIFHPDNTMDISVITSTGQRITSKVDSDYELFYNIYQD